MWSDLAGLLFLAGVLVAFALLLALAATIRRPALRIWPTPGEKTWQSYLFWPLFRGLNLLSFAVAGMEWTASRTGTAGLPAALRLLALVLLVASVAVFLSAFRLLGRDNSYGASDGLVTGGIYQWTRNPQNAMLIVVYGCLALAADNGRVWLLCAAMMAVYALMVLAEEPWLEGVYGDAYRRYCAAVPRFFHWRKALRVLARR